MALYVTYHPEEATKKQKKEMKKNKNKTDWLIDWLKHIMTNCISFFYKLKQ